MKAQYARIVSALCCIAVIFTVILFARVGISGAAPTVLMFHNDRAWTQNTRLPAEEIHSVYYVPVSLFVQLPSVDVRMNNTLQTFIITYGDKYLSFDTSTNFAANQNKERMYLKTAEYHGERYVPIGAVCESLGLVFEQYEDPTTASVALRITDGTNKESLEKLARSFYPGYFPETTATTVPPDTSVPDTSRDTTEPPKPVLSERIIYITFDSSPSQYTADILDVLKKYNCRATFFVMGNEAKSRADVLSAIAANGHAIALHATSESAAALTSTEDILSDIKSQNELLERIIKQKSHIKLAPHSLSDAARETLSDMGYQLWEANVVISPTLSVSRASSSAINGIWNNEIAVLRFTDSRYTAAVLERVLSFIAQNRSVCELRVISTAFDS